MDTIRKYFCCTLGQRSTSPPSPVPPSPPSSSKIASAIVNSLSDSPGVIVLVHEKPKVDALKNDDNDDTRIDIALDRTVCTTVSSAIDARLVFISIREGVTVHLINHEDGSKDDERLESHCRGMALTGTVQLLFGNIEDSRQPQSYILSAGDHLVLTAGTYYIRASTEIHSIHLNKQAYLTASVQYYPAKVDDSAKLMQFVQELTSD